MKQGWKWWLNIVISLPDDRCYLKEYSRRANTNSITLSRKLLEFQDKQLVTLLRDKKHNREIQIQLTEKGKQFRNVAHEFSSFLK